MVDVMHRASKLFPVHLLEFFKNVTVVYGLIVSDYATDSVFVEPKYDVFDTANYTMHFHSTQRRKFAHA